MIGLIMKSSSTDELFFVRFLICGVAHVRKQVSIFITGHLVITFLWCHYTDLVLLLLSYGFNCFDFECVLDSFPDWVVIQ